MDQLRQMPKAWLSPAERKILLQVVKAEAPALLQPNTVKRIRPGAWNSITAKFNASTGTFRNTRQLRACIQNLLRRTIQKKSGPGTMILPSRKTNFTNFEKQVIINLGKEHLVIFSKQKDNETQSKKRRAWTSIMWTFNRTPGIDNQRTAREIKTCLINMTNRTQTKEVNELRLLISDYLQQNELELLAAPEMRVKTVNNSPLSSKFHNSSPMGQHTMLSSSTLAQHIMPSMGNLAPGALSSPQHKQAKNKQSASLPKNALSKKAYHPQIMSRHRLLLPKPPGQQGPPFPPRPIFIAPASQSTPVSCPSVHNTSTQQTAAQNYSMAYSLAQHNNNNSETSNQVTSMPTTHTTHSTPQSSVAPTPLQCISAIRPPHPTSILFSQQAVAMSSSATSQSLLHQHEHQGAGLIIPPTAGPGHASEPPTKEHSPIEHIIEIKEEDDDAEELCDPVSLSSSSTNMYQHIQKTQQAHGDQPTDSASINLIQLEKVTGQEMSPIPIGESSHGSDGFSNVQIRVHRTNQAEPARVTSPPSNTTTPGPRPSSQSHVSPPLQNAGQDFSSGRAYQSDSGGCLSGNHPPPPTPPPQHQIEKDHTPVSDANDSGYLLHNATFSSEEQVLPLEIDCTDSNLPNKSQVRVTHTSANDAQLQDSPQQRTKPPSQPRRTMPPSQPRRTVHNVADPHSTRVKGRKESLSRMKKRFMQDEHDLKLSLMRKEHEWLLEEHIWKKEEHELRMQMIRINSKF